MGDEPLENVFQSLVLAEGVDADDVLGDVVDREVFHGGDFDFAGVHFVISLFCLLWYVLWLVVRGEKNRGQAQLQWVWGGGESTI